MNIQFIQLTDLWHVLQVTLTDTKPGKSIKKKKKYMAKALWKLCYHLSADKWCHKFKLKRSCKNFKMLKIE